MGKKAVACRINWVIMGVGRDGGSRMSRAPG